MGAADTLEIQRTLGRFMNSFDLKDWDAMKAVLADRLHVDYFDLRGEAPHFVSSDDYVAARIAALQSLQTHHLIANFDVEARDDSANARATCVIFRADGEARFTSHAFYEFGLVRAGSDWKIGAIKQSILWNDGDPRLHAGVPK